MTSKITTAGSDAGRLAVAGVLARLYKAWEANDAGAFVADDTDDAGVIQPGVYEKDREEIRIAMAAAFAGPLNGSRASDHLVDVRFVVGDTAIVVSEGGIIFPGQDAFASLYLRWNKLRNADSALAYLRKTVVNNALSVLRHRAIAARNAEAAGERHEPGAEDEALVLFERSAVAAALGKLSARQRVAVVLRYYGGLSEAEIATAMGTSESMVKSHTSRGMAALRAELAHGQESRL